MGDKQNLSNQDAIKKMKDLAEEVDFPIHVRLNIRPVAGIKREAGAQHASQGGGMTSSRWSLFGIMNWLFGGEEDYMQAYPLVNGEFSRKRDLLDGI